MPPFLLALTLLGSGPSSEAAKAIALRPQTPTSTTPRSDADLEDQVRAMLGAIDTPVTRDQWRALGVGAEPLLLRVAESDAQLPSRRARAVDGLSALAQPETATRVARLAEDDAMPFIVRLAAVRALKAQPFAAATRPALERLLTAAADARVRASAADALASDASGCEMVRRQLAREAPEAPAPFERAARACGLPLSHPR